MRILDADELLEWLEKAIERWRLLEERGLDSDSVCLAVGINSAMMEFVQEHMKEVG